MEIFKKVILTLVLFGGLILSILKEQQIVAMGIIVILVLSISLQLREQDKKETDKKEK